MITLQPINETNFMEAAALHPFENQRSFVASAPMILARAYAYRNQNAVCWGICHENQIVGLAMLHDMEAEPACYHLCEFLIDSRHQNEGIGQAALRRILNHCNRERKFDRVEVCVKKENSAAIHVYEKAGFRDSGYQDPDAPDSICMVYTLPEIQIMLTEKEDLPNVQRLWKTPEVMYYVGFPDGLHETLEHLEHKWLPWVKMHPTVSISAFTPKASVTVEKAFMMWMKQGLPAWISNCCRRQEGRESLSRALSMH